MAAATCGGAHLVHVGDDEGAGAGAVVEGGGNGGADRRRGQVGRADPRLGCRPFLFGLGAQAGVAQGGGGDEQPVRRRRHAEREGGGRVEPVPVQPGVDLPPVAAAHAPASPRSPRRCARRAAAVRAGRAAWPARRRAASRARFSMPLAGGLEADAVAGLQLLAPRRLPAAPGGGRAGSPAAPPAASGPVPAPRPPRPDPGSGGGGRIRRRRGRLPRPCAPAPAGGRCAGRPRSG